MTFGLSSMKIGALRQSGDRHADLRPVLRADPPGLQALPVDLGLGGQDALGQLQMAHLQGEQERWSLRLQAHVRQDSEGEAGLAHAGTGSDDVEGGRLEPEEDLVELVVARRHTGDGRTSLPELLDAVQSLPQQFTQGVHGLGRPPFRHVEHELLGRVDGELHVLGDRVADVGDLPGHPDELPQQGVLLDDDGVVPGVGDRRCVGLERDEHRRVTHRLEQSGTLELVGDRHGVDRLAPLQQRPDRREDVPVSRLVEVAGRAHLDAHRGRVERQQHRPEQRLLRVEVVRGHPRTGHGGHPERGVAGIVDGVDHGPLLCPAPAGDHKGELVVGKLAPRVEKPCTKGRHVVKRSIPL